MKKCHQIFWIAVLCAQKRGFMTILLCGSQFAAYRANPQPQIVTAKTNPGVHMNYMNYIGSVFKHYL